MPMMDSVTLENFRCFRERQTARLAPLTLLVGENSTGKTSLLAMVRVLADYAYNFKTPNFKEPPYDLGSFDEIVYHRSTRGSRSESFVGRFEDRCIARKLSVNTPGTFAFEVAFQKGATAPIPAKERVELADAWAEESFNTGDSYASRVGNARGEWKLKLQDEPRVRLRSGDYLEYLRMSMRSGIGIRDAFSFTFTDEWFEPVGDSPAFTAGEADPHDDIEAIRRLAPMAIYAAAPVRASPQRTYDPRSLDADAGGNEIPSVLAHLSMSDPTAWERLKSELEEFGRDAGLFDEIRVRRLGSAGGDPFQLQVRIDGGRRRGPWRNIIDVGYGISQILPIVIPLLRDDAPDLALLQQPEVHLHPSAQAALGTRVSRLAASGHQVVVETHSDHLMDRVRMEVRDGDSGLHPEDVSLLYFERNGLDVTIHSLQFDSEGNVHPVPDHRGDIPEMPDSYRRFFMEETRRSLGL